MHFDPGLSLRLLLGGVLRPALHPLVREDRQKPRRFFQNQRPTRPGVTLLPVRMPNSTTSLARLEQAIQAYVAYQADPDRVSPDEFLAAHPDLRDLLEPMLEEDATPSDDTVNSWDPDEPNGSVEGLVHLGRYRLTQELGRGGMGVVYEATDVDLGRRVALKILPGQPLLSPAQIDRFRREAAAVARLDHPGIVKLFEVGEHNGTHFFAMELIQGPTLAEHEANSRGSNGHSSPDSRPGPGCESSRRKRVESRTRLVAGVARALDYAHRHGVIHRDVKPQNILLGPNGRVCLVDFGLAKDIESVSVTASGAFAGTLRYASPEQAAGQPVDPRTDIYSLGAVFFELLTGESPLGDASDGQALVALMNDEPRPLHRVRACAPRDLEWICRRALASQPDDRYPTAAAMAEDLERFLTGEPIARPQWLWTRTAWSALRRRRRILGSVMAAGLLAGGLVWAVLNHTWEQQALAQRSRQLAAFEQRQEQHCELLQSLIETPLNSLPHGEAAYAEQIRSALEIADDLIEEGGSRISSRLALSAGRLMASAGPFFLDLQDPATALELFDRSIPLLELVVARDPENLAVRGTLAGVRHNRWLASSSASATDPDLVAAIEMWQQIVDSAPSAQIAPVTLDNARAGLARAQCNQAIRLLQDGGGSLDQARNLLESATFTCPEPRSISAKPSSHALRTRIWIDLVQAQIARRVGDLRSAKPMFESLVRRIDDLPPRLLRERHTLRFKALIGQAGVACATGAEDSDQLVLAAIHAGEELTKAFPATPRTRYELAALQYNQASALFARGRFGSGIETIHAAIQRIDGRHTRVARLLRAELRGMLALGQWSTKAISPEAADKCFAAADHSLASLTQGPEPHPRILSKRAVLLNNWANLKFGGLKAPGVAKQMARRAIALQKTALARGHGQYEFRDRLITHQVLLAMLVERERDAEAAIEAAREIVATSPHSNAARVAAARCICRLLRWTLSPAEPLQAEAVAWLRNPDGTWRIPPKNLRRLTGLRPLHSHPDFQAILNPPR